MAAIRKAELTSVYPCVTPHYEKLSGFLGIDNNQQMILTFGQTSH